MRRQTCEAVEVGQLRSRIDGVGRSQGQGLERLAARGHRVHVVALEAQGAVDGAADRQIVVHHQDAHDHRTYRVLRRTGHVGLSNL
jgi:hypothetical protein